MAPINAEALPAFLAKGARVSPAVFGLVIPKHVRNKNNMPIVSYRPKRVFIANNRNTILITDCEIKAAKIICSLLNLFKNTELSWLPIIRLKDIKANIQP